MKKEPRFETKLSPFKHQREAFLAIKDLDYAAIFHEQGLGKTKIAIDLAIYWLKQKFVETIIIVAKRGLVKNWIDELATHNYLKPSILGTSSSQNYIIFNSQRRLILTHYEAVRKEEKRLKLYLKTRKTGLFLDESTKIKNPNSALTKSFFQLSKLFTKRIIMSGQPIANRPYDIWAQIKFLDFGEHLGNDFKSFKKDNDLSNDLEENVAAQCDFAENLNAIWPKISSFSIRETKKNCSLELPEKLYETIYSEWEPKQLRLYNEVRDLLSVSVLKDGKIVEDSSEEILKRLLRLVQIASNPALIDDGYKTTPGKVANLTTIVNKIISQNEKCIVWTSFVKNADYLSNYLSDYGTCKVHGKLSHEIRNKSLESFKNNAEKKILIATPGAAKEGLTLTNANHVIFFDRTFSLDDYLQSQDRIHRISQKRTCHVYVLLMKDSIDEWVDALIETKHEASMLGQGDYSSIEEFKETISFSFSSMLKNVLAPSNSLLLETK